MNILMDKKKVFFVGYGGGHIPILDIICESLLDTQKYDVKILGLTAGYPAISGKYSSDVATCISDYYFLFDEEIETILKYGVRIFKENYNKDIGISKFDTIMYLGLSYYNNIQKFSTNC